MKVVKMSQEAQEALFENLCKHFQAIQNCIDSGFRMPALILIYTGIDIFASLARPSGKEHTSRKDYIDWCERYLIPNEKLSCSAIDLYAARCGVVHTYTMHSSLSDQGKANEIVYAWGNRKPEDLQEFIDKVGYTQRVIHIETLVQLFLVGAQRFLTELDSDKNMAELVILRAGKSFKDQLYEFWR